MLLLPAVITGAAARTVSCAELEAVRGPSASSRYRTAYVDYRYEMPVVEIARRVRGSAGADDRIRGRFAGQPRLPGRRYLSRRELKDQRSRDGGNRGAG